MKTPVQVIIASQAGTLRARLRLHLDSRPGFVVVGEARNHREAIAAAASGPDVILVDQDINEGAVLEHIPDLVSAAKHVLIISGSYDEARKVWLASLGARDIVMEEMVRDAIMRYTDTEAEKIAQLTEDERAVIVLVASGLDDQRIAERLSITNSAVLDHLESIYEKLNVDGRFELLIYSFLKGLANSVIQCS